MHDATPTAIPQPAGSPPDRDGLAVLGPIARSGAPASGSDSRAGTHGSIRASSSARNGREEGIGGTGVDSGGNLCDALPTCP